MTFEEVLAAARGLTWEEKRVLAAALWEELQGIHVGTSAAVPAPGLYLAPPNPGNGWKWGASAGLLEAMQRQLDECLRKEAS